MIRSTMSRLKRLLDPRPEDPFADRELSRHQDSWIEPQKLGSIIPPYRPTYPFDEGFINQNHAYYASCPAIDGVLVDVGIPGWLRREDALKIYELAYYSPGDILEIGTYQGLSTSIIATAIADSSRKSVLTVDLSPEFSGKARSHLQARGLETNVTFFANDAAVFCEKLVAEGRQFSFIFVDHSHEYEPGCDGLPADGQAHRAPGPLLLPRLQRRQEQRSRQCQLRRVGSGLRRTAGRPVRVPRDLRLRCSLPRQGRKAA
jgi:hypothetical protein